MPAAERSRHDVALNLAEMLQKAKRLWATSGTIETTVFAGLRRSTVTGERQGSIRNPEIVR